MNELINELEKDYIYLDSKRNKYKNINFEIERAYCNALNEIWKVLTLEIVKHERGDK